MIKHLQKMQLDKKGFRDNDVESQLFQPVFNKYLIYYFYKTRSIFNATNYPCHEETNVFY